MVVARTCLGVHACCLASVLLCIDFIFFFALLSSSLARFTRCSIGVPPDFVSPPLPCFLPPTFVCALSLFLYRRLHCAFSPSVTALDPPRRFLITTPSPVLLDSCTLRLHFAFSLPPSTRQRASFLVLIESPRTTGVCVCVCYFKGDSSQSEVSPCVASARFEKQSAGYESKVVDTAPAEGDI